MVICSAFLFVVGPLLIWCDRARADTIQLDGLVAKLIFEVDVPANAAGPLTEIQVRQGDSVSAGQILAKVDDRQLDIEVRLAEVASKIAERKASGFQEDEIAIKMLQSAEQMKTQRQLLAELAQKKAGSETRIESAKKSTELAKNELERAVKAREAFVDSVSQSEVDNLRLKYEQSQLLLQQAVLDREAEALTAESEKSALQMAMTEVETAKLKIAGTEVASDLLRLNAKAAEQNLLLAQLAVQRSRIVAPEDATVVEVYRRRGEWVQPGEKVVRLVGLKQLQAEGFLAADLVKRFRRGVEVDLSLASKPDVKWKGVVDFISPEVDRINDEVRFLVRFDNPDQRVLPGMQLTLSVDLR